MRAVRAVAGAALFAPALLSAMGCLPPTQITVSITTNVACERVTETGLRVALLEDLAARPPATTTPECGAGDIGSLVLVPTKGKNDEVAFEVVTGVDTALDDCLLEPSKRPPGARCIAARRALHYIAERPLVVPVTMRESCVNVECLPSETCVDKDCRPARIDPASCAEGVCGEEVLPPAEPPKPDPKPDPGVPGPSCAGLPATCGASQNDGCCASALVPGGTFLRSYDGKTYVDDGNQATVSDFRLDVYEVTVGRFRRFVAAAEGTQSSPPANGAGAHPLVEGSGWDPSWSPLLPLDTEALKTSVKCNATYQTWTDDAADNETLPMNCVSWYEAFAFCAWDGGRLPTEAEWNYAAAGGGEQREYPWGSGIDPSYATYDCLGDGEPDCAFTDILPAGSKPKGKGRWGNHDLVGSVWEWNLDWYAESYANPCVDCANLLPASDRAGRGGGLFGASSFLRVGGRGGADPLFLDRVIGLRCARTP